MSRFESAEWIWKKGDITPDSYAEFVSRFSFKKSGDVILKIAYDSIVNVYVNGSLVLAKQCADYPYYKLYDEIDITKYCTEENEIRIFVWYLGEDSAVYYNAQAGLIFEVKSGAEILAASGVSTKSRTDTRYKNGYRKLITGQLGYSFFYDATKENSADFEDSVTVEKSLDFKRFALEYCDIKEAVPAQIVKKNANSIIFDIGREECGFLSIDVNSSAEQTITLAYGEHLRDGGVARFIGTRDFSFEVRVGEGRTRYANMFRRLAGRYIEVFFEKPLNFINVGIMPVLYPLNENTVSFGDELTDRIYSTAVRTLRLCMHEHYEDCPWREQAMYALDSRNQMLCGYYAFGEYRFARENLILMSKGLKDNGLLELTYPAKNTPAIPFFSLAYPMMLAEYVEYSGDKSIIDEVMPALDSIMNCFNSRIGENGLIANLPYPFWNFYEWADGSHNDNEIIRTPDEPYMEKYDLILNCAYVLAVEHCDKLLGTKTDLSYMKKQIDRLFFDESKGLYKATLKEDLSTELGNSLAVLAGVAVGEKAERITAALKSENDMVKITLSMMCFKYDALLKESKENAEFVKADIMKNYSYMLDFGATSFWETIDGAEAFEGAGSLCHGWSAMPVYYLNILK